MSSNQQKLSLVPDEPDGNPSIGGDAKPKTLLESWSLAREKLVIEAAANPTENLQEDNNKPLVRRNSEKEDKGDDRVEFPDIDISNISEADAETTNEQQSGFNKTVFVLEQSKEDRSSLVKALTASNFRVYAYGELEKALRAYAELAQTPDIVMLALDSPTFKALKFLEKVPPVKIPVVLLIKENPNNIMDAILQGINLGASCHISKPYNSSFIQRIIDLEGRYCVAEEEMQRLLEYSSADYQANYAKRLFMEESKKGVKKQQEQSKVKKNEPCLDLDGVGAKHVKVKFASAIKKSRDIFLKKKMIKRYRKSSVLGKKGNSRRVNSLQGLATVLKKNENSTALPLLKDFQSKVRLAKLPWQDAENPLISDKRKASAAIINDVLQCDFREQIPKRMPTTSGQRFLIQGFDHKRKGNLKKAIEHYTRASQADRQYLSAFLCRGVAHHLVGADTEALDDFNTCLSIDPKSVNSLFNRALIYYYIGDDKSALIDIDTAISLDSSDVELLRCRALIYRRNGDFDLANTDYKSRLNLIKRKEIVEKENRLQRKREIRQRRIELGQNVSDEESEYDEEELLLAEKPYEGIETKAAWDTNGDGRIDLQEFQAANEYGDDVYTYIFNKPSEVYLACQKEPDARTFQDIETIYAAAAEIELLRRIPQRLVRELCKGLKIANVTEGQCIIRQGAPGVNFYLLLTGGVDIRWEPPHGGNISTVNKLGPGTYFGEGAFTTKGGVRHSSVFATSDSCLFIVTEALFFQARLNEYIEKEKYQTSQILRNSHLFDGLNEDDFGSLVFVSKPNYYDRNEVLILQGDRGSKFCILISGLCRMLKFSDLGADLMKKDKDLSAKIKQYEMAYVFHHSVKDPDVAKRAEKARRGYEKMKAELQDIRKRLIQLREKRKLEYLVPSKNQHKIVSEKVLYPSNFFGEVAIIDPYHGTEACTVVSETYVKVIEINKELLQVYKQPEELIEKLKKRSRDRFRGL